MKNLVLTLSLAFAALALSACDKGGGGGNSGTVAQTPCSNYVYNQATGQYTDSSGRIIIPGTNCSVTNGTNGNLFQTNGGQGNCAVYGPTWMPTWINGQIYCISQQYYQQTFNYVGPTYPNTICQGYQCTQNSRCQAYVAANVNIDFLSGQIGFCF